MIFFYNPPHFCHLLNGRVSVDILPQFMRKLQFTNKTRFINFRLHITLSLFKSKIFSDLILIRFQ